MSDGIDQDQLDRLFTAALETAIARIEKDGSFFPLVFELRATGEIQAVAVLEKDGADSIDGVVASFARLLSARSREGIVRASAIAVYAQDAITVRLRAPNYSADIAAPYTLKTSGMIKRRRELELGEIGAKSAPNDVFPA